MRIALLGYGKMGKEIEKIALTKGHEISLKVTSENRDFTVKDLADSDVAIEFSRPESVVANIYKCFEANVPVVVGTTAWEDKLEEVSAACETQKQSLLHASNFSIGVNIFFALNQKLAQIMNAYPTYDVSLEEIHHTAKLDSPSGTAITTANGILAKLDRKSQWLEGTSTDPSTIQIDAKRIENVPGTHTVKFNSDIDSITMTHTAHNRRGFASGAVLAAEWIIGKSGVFTMNDLLNLNEA